MTNVNRPETPVPANPAAEAPQKSGLNLSRHAQQAIGITTMLLCLLVSGGIMYWFLFGTTSHARQVKVDPALQTPGGGGPGGMPPALRRGAILGVDRTDGKNWTVRGSTGAIRVVRDDKGVYQFNYFYPNGAGISEQDNRLWIARRRATQDQAMAKEWGITPDQLAKLKKIDAPAARLNPSPEQRQMIAAHWETYLKASDGPSRMDSEKALIDALDGIAKSAQPASKSAAQAAIDQIKQLLTPEQVEKMSK